MRPFPQPPTVRWSSYGSSNSLSSSETPSYILGAAAGIGIAAGIGSLAGALTGNLLGLPAARSAAVAFVGTGVGLFGALYVSVKVAR